MPSHPVWRACTGAREPRRVLARFDLRLARAVVSRGVVALLIADVASAGATPTQDATSDASAERGDSSSGAHEHDADLPPDPPASRVRRDPPKERTAAEPTLKRRWSRVATSASVVAAGRHGLAFEAQTDGADIELRIVNRTRDRRWWCGPERLLEWIELVAIGEHGELVPALWEGGPEAVPTDGYTWSIGAGDTLWVGTVDVEVVEAGIHATLDDGRSLDLGIGDAVRVALEIPTSTAATHGDCLRRAQTRWYAASEFRAELPWGVPGAPLDRVFPSTVGAIDEIGSIDLKAPTYEFRFREKGIEGTMR